MTRRNVMMAILLVGLGAEPSLAQTLPYDHIHLAAPDQEQAVAWYRTHFGGAAGELPERTRFGPVLLIWSKRADSPRSDGGVIDHIGFSVPDVAGKVGELRAAGATVLTAPHELPGLYRRAVVEDPWGVKLEIVQDADRQGLHHVHLRLTDPAKALTWYADRFGGERARLKGQLEGLRFDGLWLLIDKVDTPSAGSSGRAIDHLGWRARDLVAEFARYKARGDTIAAEPRPLRDNHYGFIEDPNGVRIEVIQRPQF
jgi:catechol 2,3-dioxygenase-like lactoylglutathione lyase family enzyme